MFKKPFKVKSNTAIRGSERRKFRDAVGRNYPEIPSDMLSTLVPNKEEMTVMKILTYSEQNITCYCLKKNPIFFEINGSIMPTVYTLWQHPNFCLSFKTFPNVLSKLQGGADLMFPGIIPPLNGFSNFERNRVASVSLLGNGAAVAVGMTTCSKQEVDMEGAQGKKIAIYHCVKDYLWAAGDKSDIPHIEEEIEVPLSLTQFETEDGNHAEDDVEEEADQENTLDADVSKTENNGDKNNDIHQMNSVDNSDVSTDNVAESLVELSPQEEMDLLLQNCFYQAIINAKKAELPMLVTKFSSQYLHPA